MNVFFCFFFNNFLFFIVYLNTIFYIISVFPLNIRLTHIHAVLDPTWNHNAALRVFYTIRSWFSDKSNNFWNHDSFIPNGLKKRSSCVTESIIKTKRTNLTCLWLRYPKEKYKRTNTYREYAHIHTIGYY